MQPRWVIGTAFLILTVGMAPADETKELKLSDCPAAVRETFQAEAKGAKFEGVEKEKDDEGDTIYWADLSIHGKTYSVGVLEDGTLSEMNLAVDDEETPFDRSPAAVQATFKSEAFGERVETLGKDIKYGVPIYDAVVSHKGKSYEIVVAEDGTLVEKVLVIDDEAVELAMCPAPVQAALHEQGKGGTIHEITRSTGIGHFTYEAEVEVKGKVYLIELDATGLLLSKSLEAGEE